MSGKLPFKGRKGRLEFVGLVSPDDADKPDTPVSGELQAEGEPTSEVAGVNNPPAPPSEDPAAPPPAPSAPPALPKPAKHPKPKPAQPSPKPVKELATSSPVFRRRG